MFSQIACVFFTIIQLLWWTWHYSVSENVFWSQFSVIFNVINALPCNRTPQKLNLATWNIFQYFLCVGDKDSWKHCAANYKAWLFSDTLDTSLGTNSCGSLQLHNVAEANSHIHNGKQGPFSKAIVWEKYCYWIKRVAPSSQQQPDIQRFQQDDVETYSGASHIWYLSSLKKPSFRCKARLVKEIKGVFYRCYTSRSVCPWRGVQSSLWKQLYNITCGSRGAF